ncbi:MAG: PIN domain-containing protein [Euryarchaeota archaeon]|nr:PIN domain-containing protein [Euryarchaeota archaeon]
MTVVLDSSFLSDVRRGDPGALDLLERLARDEEAALVPSVVVAEYLAGSRNPGSDLATLDRAAVLDDFRVNDARAAAALSRQMFLRGAFPGWIDALVAGFAKARGDLRVVTKNVRHFPESPTLSY